MTELGAGSVRILAAAGRNRQTALGDGLTALAIGLSLLTPAMAEPGTPPHLERRGAATQLIVDGHPFLIRGGELANTASSAREYLAPIFPRLARLNLNTALVGVSWAQVEPEEGRFDFDLVDAALEGARQSHLKVIFIWFGSWKNGISSFAPPWVKADQARFPRVKVRYGHSLEVLSPASDANREADERAYVAFLRHVRQADEGEHTTLMVQLENEVGVLGDSRDRSALAEAAFVGPVPAVVRQRLGGGDGNWEQAFGAGAATDERFMAFAYAHYMDHLAAAGKSVYPLPVFTNTWIVQPEDKLPGDYPSGGPEPHVLDLWRAVAPHIDLNAPDIYLPNFTEWVGHFHRSDNPLFVPESRGDALGVANAFYAIGRHGALGYSPFGIDDVGRLLTLRPDAGSTRPTEVADLPLTRGYAVLAELTPSILEAQAAGRITGVSLNPERPKEDVQLGGCVLHFDLLRNFRDPSKLPPYGYGLAIEESPGHYLIAGCDLQVTFTPATEGPPIAGLARVEAGDFAAGHWTVRRVLNGDDVLLNYHLAEAAAAGQSGSGVKFPNRGAPTIQKVTLYRYGP